MDSIENKINNSPRLDSETANELLRDLVEIDKENTAHKSVIEAESQSELSLLHHNEINAQVTK
jgi:hypothetical protein